MKDSIVPKDVKPGLPIRFLVESEARFEPLSLEDWQAKFLVVPAGFNSLDIRH